MHMKRILPLVLALAVPALARAGDKLPFKLHGVYTETCACTAPCKCDLTGDVPPSCQGVGAFTITSGSYGGQDLSGVSLAYAGKPGEWVRLYVDAPDQARRDTAEKLGRALFAGWGRMDAVKNGQIAITGSMGRYTVTVDGGRVMKYTTEPVLGGDGKTAVLYSNTHNPVISSYLQARSGTPLVYHDDGRSIELDAGRNAFFHDAMDSSGQI
jgi:hypothetical protein